MKNARGMMIAIGVCILTAGGIYVMHGISDARNGKIISSKQQEAVRELLAAETMETVDMKAFSDNEAIESVYQGKDSHGNLVGYVIFTSVKGYGGPMSVHVATDPQGNEIKSLRVGANNETENLGALTAEEGFYRQFTGRRAPLRLKGETEENTISVAPEAPMTDGVYRAEDDDYVNGFRYFVEIEVEDGKIIKANWDGVQEDGRTKKELSRNGEYIMTEKGPLWYEQASDMEQVLLQLQEPSLIEMNDEGKTDAVSSVSISVSDFVKLAQKCVNEAKGFQEAENAVDNSSDEYAIEGISGATISSKAVVKAANLAAEFVRNNLASA